MLDNAQSLSAEEINDLFPDEPVEEVKKKAPLNINSSGIDDAGDGNSLSAEEIDALVGVSVPIEEIPRDRERKEIDPKDAKNYLDLQEKTQKPIQEIEQNPDRVKAEFERKEKELAPVTHEWLENNPEYKAVIKNPENLNWTEKMWSGFKLKAEAGKIQNVSAYPLALKEFLGASLSKEDRGKLKGYNENLSNLNMKYEDLQLGFFSGIPQEALNQLFTIANLGATSSIALGAGTLGGAALGALVRRPASGALTGFNLTKKAVLPMSVALLESVWMYQEIKGLKDEDGNPIDQKTARAVSLVAGGINGALELVGLRTIFKSVPQSKKLLLDKIIKNKVMKSQLVRVLASVAEAGTVEAFTEGMQEFVNVVGEEFAKVKDKFVSDEDKLVKSAMPLGVMLSLPQSASKKANLAQLNNMIDGIFTSENMARIAMAAKKGGQAGLGLSVAGSAVGSTTRGVKGKTEKTKLGKMVGSAVSKVKEATIGKVQKKAVGEQLEKLERDVNYQLELVRKEADEFRRSRASEAFAGRLEALGLLAEAKLKDVGKAGVKSYLQSLAPSGDGNFFYISKENLEKIDGGFEALGGFVQEASPVISIPVKHYFKNILSNKDLNMQFIPFLRENANAKNLSESQRDEKVRTEPTKKEAKPTPKEQEAELDNRKEENVIIEQKAEKRALKDPSILDIRDYLKQEIIEGDLHTKILPDISKNKMNEAEGKLYFEGEIPEHLKPFFAKDGMSLAETALKFGYKSEFEFIDQFLDSPVTNKQIDEYVDATIKENQNLEESFADMKEDYRATDPIIRARIEKENASLIPDKDTLKDIKSDAASALDSVPVHLLEPSLYKREADEATGYHKVWYNEFYIQSAKRKMDLRRRTASVTRKIKKVVGRGEVTQEHSIVQHILKRMNVFESEIEKMPDLKKAQADEYGPIYALDIPSFILNDDFKVYGLMRTDHAEQAIKVSESLLFISNIKEGEFFTSKGRRKEALSRIADDINKYRNKKILGFRKSQEKREEGIAKEYLAAVTKIEFLIQRLEGAGRSTELTKRLWNPMKRAEDNNNKRNTALVKKLNDIGLTAQKIKEWKKSPVYTYVSADGNIFVHTRKLGNKRIKDEGFKEIVLTKEDVASIIKQLGNKEGLDRVQRKYELDAEQLSKIASQAFDSTEVAVLKRMESIPKAYWPQVVALQKETKNVAPKAVEAMPHTIQFKDGKSVSFEGGYYPIKYEGSNAQELEYLEKEIDGTNQSNYNSLMTDDGHTKTRADSSRFTVRTDLGVFQQAYSEIIRDLSFRKALIDGKTILKDPNVSDAIIKAVGKKEYEVMIEWLRNIANPKRNYSPSLFARGLTWTTRSMVLNFMAFNAGVGLLQFTGLGISAHKIGMDRSLFTLIGQGLKYSPQGIIGLVNPDSFVNTEAAQLSSFMKHRQRKGMDADVANMVNYGWYEAFLMGLIRNADNVVSNATWIASYKQALGGRIKKLGKNITQTDAIRYADESVSTTQGSGDTIHQTNVQLGGALEKSITPFLTYFAVVWNQGRLTAYEAQRQIEEGRADKAMLTGFSYYMTILMISHLERLYREGLPDWQNMSMGDKLWWTFKPTIPHFSASLPVVRNVVSGIIENFSAVPAMAMNFPENVVKGVKALRKTAKEIKEKGHVSKKDIQKILTNYNIAVVVGVATRARAPLVPVRKGLMAVFEFENERGMPHRNFRALNRLLTGKPSWFE